jgi:hypothetical protein
VLGSPGSVFVVEITALNLVSLREREVIVPHTSQIYQTAIIMSVRGTLIAQ